MSYEDSPIPLRDAVDRHHRRLTRDGCKRRCARSCALGVVSEIDLVRLASGA